MSKHFRGVPVDLLEITDWGKNELLRLVEAKASDREFRSFWDEYHEKLMEWKTGEYVQAL